jgi:hypothetical protein
VGRPSCSDRAGGAAGGPSIPLIGFESVEPEEELPYPSRAVAMSLEALCRVIQVPGPDERFIVILVFDDNMSRTRHGLCEE